MTYTVIFTLPSPTLLNYTITHVVNVFADSAEHAINRVVTGIPGSTVCMVFEGEHFPIRLVSTSKLWVL